MLDEDDLSHLYMWLYGNMPFCGCGWPYSVMQLIVTVLDDITANESWETITSHITGNDIVAQLVFGVIENAGLIEHGTSFTSSWVTARGKWVQQAFRRVSLIDLENAGFPHNGDECPATCTLGSMAS